MDRATLADEARAEPAENACGLNEYAPEVLGVLAVVGGVDAILAEADRIGNLIGQFVDTDVDAKLSEGAHDLGIQIGNRARVELDLRSTAVAGRCPQHVIEEIEVELKAAIAVRDRRGGQPARRDIEHHVP